MTDPQTDFDIDVEIEMEGFKSSEGDGRTAADIRREMQEAKDRDDKTEETSDGTE